MRAGSGRGPQINGPAPASESRKERRYISKLRGCEFVIERRQQYHNRLVQSLRGFSVRLLPIILHHSYLRATIGSALVSRVNGTDWYSTPGVRFKIPTGTRLSFYLAGGGGVASTFQNYNVVNGMVVASSSGHTIHPAGDAAGGIDLRISRWFSLRAEARGFFSSPSPENRTTRGVALFGIAFHL